MTPLTIKLSISALLYLAEVVHGANILVLEGLASPSHHIFMRVVNEALAAEGHNVTSVSADVEKNPVANLTYLHNDKVYDFLNMNAKIRNYVEIGRSSDVSTIISTEEYALNTLRGIRMSKGYKQLLAYPDDFQFDLIIYDFEAMPLLLGFHHKFGQPPLIGVSAFSGIAVTNAAAGSSFYPSYIPFHFCSGFKETFCGRIKNFFLYFFDHFYRNYHALPAIHAIVRDDFSNLPPFNQLESQIRLTLINYSPAIHNPEPILPNVIPIAGMHMQKVKPLTKEFQEILDSAKNGVIFFCLGTNVKSWMLGDETIQKFIEIFRQLPQYTILWKFDNETISNIPKNLIIRRWVPQNDVLAHPNTKLFISHCGLLSSLEATWHGVPIFAAPIWLDQYMNAEHLIRAGTAEVMDVRDFTSMKIKNLILTMMTSGKYHKNAETRSRLFRDQPQPPLEKTLWWINFILRNPDVDFLQGTSKHINILILHNIDVITFFILIIFTSIALVVKMRCCIHRGRPSVRKSSKKQKPN
ncbi:hypothetical protein DMENIID0001_029950 [Sergentomyia squamirostris]